MSIFSGLLNRLGIRNSSESKQIRLFLLDDDKLRHQWFAKRFSKHQLDIAETPAEAIELLGANTYDLIFLDHDLLPEHYGSKERDDERTGYAVAAWLVAHPEQQATSNIIVHTRNADGAMRMVEALRRAGRQAEYIPFPILTQKNRNFWERKD